MKKFLLPLFIASLSLIFIAGIAEAARLGGGKSLGRQNFSYSRPSSNPTAPASKPDPQTPSYPAYNAQNSQSSKANLNSRPATSSSSGMGGWFKPLAGLVIGGAVAALLFGYGFEGIQFFDILIIVLLGYGVYLLFRALHGRNRIARNEEQFAPINTIPDANFNHVEFQQSEFSSSLINSGLNARPLDPSHLTWFNEKNFLNNARTYFLSLQAAWDANRMEEIQEYVTPELFKDLINQRSQLGANFTEVVELKVDFLGLASEGDKVFAGVRYSGLIREQINEPPKEFTEIWHIQRSLNEANANWYITGIQQV